MVLWLRNRNLVVYVGWAYNRHETVCSRTIVCCKKEVIKYLLILIQVLAPALKTKCGK